MVNRKPLRPFDAPLRRSSGVVLITALVFMVVLTLIVLALMRSTTLEERMAANARDRQLALQAAEAVLRDAQVTLFASPPFEPFDLQNPLFSDTCDGGLCKSALDGRWKTYGWTDAKTRGFNVPADSDLAGVASQPRYFVEFVKPLAGGSPEKICPPLLVRVTARGVGRDGASVFVESNLVYRPKAGEVVDGPCG